MKQELIFKHPVSYKRLKDVFEDIIENYIDVSGLDYKYQAHWYKKFHQILMGKFDTYRKKIDDNDIKLYIEYEPDYGFWGKICLFDDVKIEGAVTLFDETMIKGICVLPPEEIDGKFNESLYKSLILMGKVIKEKIEPNL